MLRLHRRHETLLFVFLLAAVLAGGAAARLAAARNARLWTDEYIMLEIAGQPSVPAVIRKVATENNPPLYPVLVHLALRAFADAPHALRLASCTAGLATAALAALLTLAGFGRVPALIAGTLASYSAVAIHFSTEIRPYSLLALLVLVHLGLLWRAPEAPRVPLAAGETLLIAAALLLHYYAVLLLALGPALALARRNRRALAVQAGVSLAAAGLAAPLLLPPLLRLPVQANEYILNLWHGIGPMAPIWTLFQELLPSCLWPAEPLRFGHFGMAPSLAAAATTFAAALAVGFLATRGRRRDASAPAGRGAALAGISFTLLSVAFALVEASTLAGRPIAIPGRLSCLLIAPAALLVAAAWRQAGSFRWASAGLAAVALIGFAWEPNPRKPVGLDEVALAGRVVRADARGPTLVITIGLYGLPMRHDLRGLSNIRYLDYPEEVAHHLGWWAPRAFLADSARSVREADEVAREAKAAAARGWNVFLFGADHPVAHPLRAALIGAFRPRLLNRHCPALQELVPRDPAAASAAPAESAGGFRHYRFPTIASAKPEVPTSRAPSVWRARS